MRTLVAWHTRFLFEAKKKSGSVGESLESCLCSLTPNAHSRRVLLHSVTSRFPGLIVLRHSCQASLRSGCSLAWCRTDSTKSFRLVRKDGLLRIAPERPARAWFSRYSSPQTLTAVAGAGEWPYLVLGRYIDIPGSNDRYIAKNGAVDPASVFQDWKIWYALCTRPRSRHRRRVLFPQINCFRTGVRRSSKVIVDLCCGRW